MIVKMSDYKKFSAKKLVQYYKEMALPAKAGIWFLICNFLQKGLAAVTTPIYTRVLTTAEYGQVSVFYSWQDIFLIFITFGLSSAVFSRGLVQHEKHQKEYSSIMVSLAFVTTIISFLVYLFLSNWLNEILEFEQILLIYIYCFFYTVIEFWSQLQRVNYKYIPFVIMTLAMTIAKPLLSVSLILLIPFGHVKIRILSDTFIMLVIGMPILGILLINGKRFFERTVWRESLMFVMPLIPHYLSQRILSQSDRIMISSMIGNKEAGIYSLAYSVGMLLMLVNTALDSTMNPWVFRKLRDKEYKRIREVTQSLIIFFALCVWSFILVVPELVKMFASSEYYGAIYIVPVIAIGSYFIYLYVQFIYFEYYIGKTKYITIATVVSAATNIILNYIGLRIFGYTAAAYATFICYAIYALFHYIVMKRLCQKELGVGNVYDGRYLAKVSVCVILVGVASMMLYHLFVIRLIIAGIVIGVTLYYAVKVMAVIGHKNKSMV